MEWIGIWIGGYWPGDYKTSMRFFDNVTGGETGKMMRMIGRLGRSMD